MLIKPLLPFTPPTFTPQCQAVNKFPFCSRRLFTAPVRKGKFHEGRACWKVSALATINKKCLQPAVCVIITVSCPNCGGIKSFFQQGMGPSSCISPSMYLFQDIYAKTPQLPGELSSSGQTHSRASSDTHSPPCHVLSLARRLCSTVGDVRWGPTHKSRTTCLRLSRAVRMLWWTAAKAVWNCTAVLSPAMTPFFPPQVALIWHWRHGSLECTNTRSVLWDEANSGSPFDSQPNKQTYRNYTI